MLAGPIARNTNRRSIGSEDQLTGVGVGLAAGVAVAVGVGDGFCNAAFDVVVELSALAANPPSVTAVSANATIASNR